MDDLPTFENDAPEPPDAPINNKPKKPMKRSRGRPKGKVKGPRAVKRKRRVPKPAKLERHHGGRYTPEQYKLIGDLMLLTQDEREAVVEIASGLVK